MHNTSEQYDSVISISRDIFFKKNEDYGTAWRILRPSSLTDQLYIKAKRIRSIEEKEEMKVKESVDMEFVGIINYCVMALIQLESEDYEGDDMPFEELKKDTISGWTTPRL